MNILFVSLDINPLFSAFARHALQWPPPVAGQEIGLIASGIACEQALPVP
jgi:hypothetical protein